MKKLFALVLAFCMALSLAACSSRSDEGTADGQSTSTPTESQPSGQPDEQETATGGDNTNTPDADTSDNGETDTPAGETGSKVLVAYFSCTGTTEGIANHIVNILGADVYEIVPEEPYTDADLNYNDSSSRSKKEQNDDFCRPAISSAVENMENYDIIFVGYPIWWGQAPKIIYTFMESYDFSGKIIVPFCTSGSSGVGSSATNLHGAVTDANWLDGTRFSASVSQSDIEEWLGGLGLELSAE